MPASKKLTLRRALVYLCAVALLVLAEPHPALYTVGIALVLVGELFRVWACGHLRKNKDVIMSGPYAHVKNPLYVGTFLIVSGLCVAASDPWNPVSKYMLYAALPLFLAVFIIYYFPYKMRVEGDRLRRHFGEKFDLYDKNVPNFFPRLTPYKGSTARWDGKLIAENSEYGTIIWVTVGSLILFSKFFIDLW